MKRNRLSPVLAVRVKDKLRRKIRRAAERSGKNESEFVRHHAGVAADLILAEPEATP